MEAHADLLLPFSLCTMSLSFHAILLKSQAHEEVRFLLYRLDFTEFYKRSAVMPEESIEETIDGMIID
jgi:hypothetical protein